MGIAVAALVVCAVAFGVYRTGRRFDAAAVGVVFAPAALALISQAAIHGRVRVIACEAAPDEEGPSCPGEAQPGDDPAAVFVEIKRIDTGQAQLTVIGRRSYGYRILTAETTHPGRAIAGILLAIRDATGVAPHVEFAWPQHSHARELLRFVLFGTGYEAAVAREILRRVEPDSSRRPMVRIG